MNKKIIAGVVSTIFLTVAVFVVNATSDAPNINICVNTKSGEVKVIGNSIADKEACEKKPNHKVLTINPNGGTDGLPGVQGVIGLTGLTGGTGAQGIQGPNSLLGLTTIADTTTTISTKILTATCPSSNPIVIGGGFKGTNSTVRESYPSGVDSWTVEISAEKNDWTVYAICSK